MVVKIRVVNRKGDAVMSDLSLEEAQREVELAIEKGYIPTVGKKKVTPLEVQDGQTVELFPTGVAG